MRTPEEIVHTKLINVDNDTWQIMARYDEVDNLYVGEARLITPPYDKHFVLRDSFQTIGETWKKLEDRLSAY